MSLILAFSNALPCLKQTFLVLPFLLFVISFQPKIIPQTMGNQVPNEILLPPTKEWQIDNVVALFCVFNFLRKIKVNGTLLLLHSTRISIELCPFLDIFGRERGKEWMVQWKLLTFHALSRDSFVGNSILCKCKCWLSRLVSVAKLMFQSLVLDNKQKAFSAFKHLSRWGVSRLLSPGLKTLVPLNKYLWISSVANFSGIMCKFEGMNKLLSSVLNFNPDHYIFWELAGNLLYFPFLIGKLFFVFVMFRA